MPVVHLQSDGSLHKVRLVDEIAGPTGPQGPVGEVGVPGVQGHTGITGPAGSQGPAGATGAQGATGITGPAGTQGPAGETGVQGAQGITGTQGLQGAQGPVGITGSTGSTGPGGAAGPTGPQGAQGPTGVTGAQGVQGNTGVQGAQGPTGNTGSQGPQGNTGVQGASGPQGNTGIQGTSGPQGATGAAGVTGIKGPTGLIGDSLASHIQLVTGGWLAAGDATNGIFFGDWTGPGTYGLVGYGGGVKQVEIRAADGILVAGGDNVIIGASGMRFMGGTGSVSWNTQSMTWWRGTERIAREYAYEVDAMTYIDPAQAWRDRYLDIRTESIAPTGQTGRATGFSLNARMDFTGLAGVGYADVHGMAGYDNSYVAVQVQNAKPAANTPPSVIVWDQMVAMHSLLLSPTSGLQNTGGITGPTGSLRYTGDLLPFRNSTAYTGYAFVPLQAPLTSTAWDGDAYSTTAKTIIDMSAVFGLPAGIKAVLASTAIRDSASAAGDCFLVLSPTNSALVGLLTDCSGQTNDSWERDVLIVPCDANGDIYYQIAASGASTMDVYLSFHGYWI